MCLVEEPLCAAFGAGVEPQQPNGAFVINIGGGTTDMAVVSQGSMSQCETVKVAGNAFDDEIVRHLKDNHSVLIGVRTAEEIKKQIGGAVPRETQVTMNVNGRSSVTGLPRTVEVTSEEIYDCLKPLLAEITAAAQIMFERTSPQLIADITVSKVILTGGSAQLYGMDELFKRALGLDVEVYPMPDLCVGKGATVALNNMHILDNYGYRYKTKEEVRIK